MVPQRVFSISAMFSLLRTLFWVPWGIVLPLAVVLCACAVYYSATFSQRLAAQWSQQMEVAPDSQVPEFAAAIAELDTAGLPCLVDGLASKRAVVRLTTQNTIDQLCNNWEFLPQEKSNHRQRRLVESFERKWYQLPMSSREFAVQVAKKILITQNNTDNTDETDITPNNRNKNRVDRIAVAVICAEICQKMERSAADTSSPMMSDIDPSENQKIAAGNVAAEDFFPVVLDRFATERAVLLTKVQRSPEWQLAKNQAGRTMREELAMVADLVEQAPVTSLAGTMNLAFVRSTGSGLFSSSDSLGTPSGPQRNGAAMFAETEPPPMMVSDVGTPFAANPQEGDTTDETHSGPLQPKRPPAIDWNEMERLTAPTPTNRATNTPNRATEVPSSSIPPTLPPPQSNTPSNFDIPLENIPLGQIPSRLYDTLSTAELMRLLQHPDVSKSQTARRILQERDRFDDSHVQLAQRIFHPNPQIRGETANVLLNNPTLNPAPWLILLTHDTDPNVRLSAFSLIATSRETQWAAQVMRQAKEDTDERIVLLGSRYEELYR